MVSVASTSEKQILHAIKLAYNKGGTRLFRNNSGIAEYANGAKVKYGLADGGSDLIGPLQIIITQEMVGKTIAVFTAIEVKKDKGVVSKTQQAFVDFIIKIGGIAGIARSVEDVKNIFDNYTTKLQTRS